MVSLKTEFMKWFAVFSNFKIFRLHDEFLVFTLKAGNFW
jgi:hypothetical protein